MAFGSGLPILVMLFSVMCCSIADLFCNGKLNIVI